MRVGLGALLTAIVAYVCCGSPSVDSGFVVQYDAFWKDGERFTVKSGSLHYFRVPAAYWRDRMQRMKALGLNTVTMYVAWNYHEEMEGQIKRLDEITGFLDAAKAENMLVLFRPGPYICGEWEMGGLPAWLLWNDKAGIKLRTWEPTYIAAVDKWLNALYAEVSSYTFDNHGPIALVQIENEYGSFGNCKDNPDDAKYMNHLLDLAVSYFGTGVVYTTIDGGEGKTAADLEKGSPWKGDARVVGTVDGGLSSPADYQLAFQRQKDFNAEDNSPKMWSELWVGWFTVWGDSHADNETTSKFNDGVKGMVDEDASFSLYMAHGGTNFGFWSGANGNQEGDYQPDITSYDYSSPISEAGDHNVGSDGGDLFAAVQSAIASQHGQPLFSEPEPIAKRGYGRVDLPDSVGLFEALGHLSTCQEPVAEGHTLPSFEDLKHNYGLALYRLSGAFTARSATFTAEATHDRAQVFVDGVEVGTAYRPSCPTTINVPSGESMDLLVENMGRINYGKGMYDHKGYLAEPPVAGNWSALCLPLLPEQVQSLPFANKAAGLLSEAMDILGGETLPTTIKGGPMFRRGQLHIDAEPTDTFFDMAGFTKGYVWVNGQNLGRYWETAGPQHTLYVPGPFLQQGDNEVITLDLHGSQSTSLIAVELPRYYATLV